MARFNRINLDGKSRTESRISEAALLPGTVLVIEGDLFETADAATAGKLSRQLYVATAAYYQGMGTPDEIPAGDTVEGEYMTEGRQLAVLATATTALTKDAPLALDAATGGLKLPDPETEEVVAFSKETVTVGASAELVLVQVA